MDVKEFEKMVGATLREVREGRLLKLCDTKNYRNEMDIKIDPSYLSRIEMGKAHIPLRTLYLLLTKYEMNIADFFERCMARTDAIGADRLSDVQRNRVRKIAIRIEQLITDYTIKLKERPKNRVRRAIHTKKKFAHLYPELKRHSKILMEIMSYSLTVISNIEFHEIRNEWNKSIKRENQQ